MVNSKDFMNLLTESVSFSLELSRNFLLFELLVLVEALLGSCEKEEDAQKFNETNHTDLKPDIIINPRMEMTGDIGQEVAQPLLLAEDGQQIIARGPGHQIKGYSKVLR